MKWLSALLLLGVFVRHDAAFLFASWTGWTPAAVFYVLGGMWEMILCGVVFLILTVCERTAWSDLASAAMLIGVVESAMVWGCRLAISAPPPRGTTACEVATGWPIGATATTLEMMALALLAVYWILRR